MSVPDTLRARVANVPESGTLSGSSCGRVICSSSERGRELRSRFASAARERLRASSYAPVFFPALKFSP